MADLEGKTLFITGASRGIGKAIALRAARDGAAVVVAAKTTEPHAQLPGTIHTAAAEIEAAGGKALACAMDVRSEDAVRAAVARAVDTFGGIDILVNNASAIHLAGTEATSLKRYDLLQAVNARGAFLCAQTCIPHLRRAANPHILNLAPPIGLEPRWCAPHFAYTLSKYGMSLAVLALAEEFRAEGIAVNALWPATTIATAAIRNLLGGEAVVRRSRTPEIVADAAHWVLTRPSRELTGRFLIDEEVLRSAGMRDLTGYAVDTTADLQTDLFLDPPAPPEPPAPG